MFIIFVLAVLPVALRIIVPRPITKKEKEIVCYYLDCYKTNVTDYTELQQAREDYINSYIKYVNSLYEYNLALIQTEMALHLHIVDIQHNDKHSTHNHADILLEHLEEAINFNEISDKNNKKSSKKNNRNKK